MQFLLRRTKHRGNRSLFTAHASSVLIFCTVRCNVRYFVGFRYSLMHNLHESDRLFESRIRRWHGWSNDSTYVVYWPAYQRLCDRWVTPQQHAYIQLLCLHRCLVFASIPSMQRPPNFEDDGVVNDIDAPFCVWHLLSKFALWSQHGLNLCDWIVIGVAS